mgnify:CR=1 FL=1
MPQGGRTTYDCASVRDVSVAIGNKARHNVDSGCYAKAEKASAPSTGIAPGKDALTEDARGVQKRVYEGKGTRGWESRRREEKRRRRRVSRTMAHVVRAIPPYRTTHDTTCHNSSSCSTVISAEPVGLTNISCPCNPLLLSIPGPIVTGDARTELNGNRQAKWNLPDLQSILFFSRAAIFSRISKIFFAAGHLSHRFGGDNGFATIDGNVGLI